MQRRWEEQEGSLGTGKEVDVMQPLNVTETDLNERGRVVECENQVRDHQ